MMKYSCHCEKNTVIAKLGELKQSYVIWTDYFAIARNDEKSSHSEPIR